MNPIENKDDYPIAQFIGRHSKKFRFWYCKKYGGRWLWWHMGLIEYSQLYTYMHNEDPNMKFTIGVDYAIDDIMDIVTTPQKNSGQGMMYFAGTRKQHREFKSWLKNIRKF